MLEFLRKDNYFSSFFLNVSYLIEYGYFLLKIYSYNVLVSSGCDDSSPISSPYKTLTLDIFHELCYCCWLFYSNSEDTYIGSIYCRKNEVSLTIVCWMGYIVHVVMLKVFGNDANTSTSRWKINSNFKYIIFGEGLVWEIKYNVGRVEKFAPVISS